MVVLGFSQLISFYDCREQLNNNVPMFLYLSTTLPPRYLTTISRLRTCTTVLVKIRQRAVLITPVCPMDELWAQRDQPALEDIKWAGLRHRGGETVPDWNCPMNYRILEEVRACSLLLELVTMSSSGADVCHFQPQVISCHHYLATTGLVEERQALL